MKKGSRSSRGSKRGARREETGKRRRGGKVLATTAATQPVRHRQLGRPIQGRK